MTLEEKSEFLDRDQVRDLNIYRFSVEFYAGLMGDNGCIVPCVIGFQSLSNGLKHHTSVRVPFILGNLVRLHLILGAEGSDSSQRICGRAEEDQSRFCNG